MRLIKPSFEILDNIDGMKIIKSIERAGRTCYKSEDKITDDSAKMFITKMIKSGHHSTLEHEKITVSIICDRGVTHEIVRHRIASYSQESTRYCNYSKDKFGNELTFIVPCFLPTIPTGSIKNVCNFVKEHNLGRMEHEWLSSINNSELTYLSLLQRGMSPQEARSILPNSLKTEIICTFNLREWRHFFKLRCSKKAHPQMREISIPILETLKQSIPVMFDDITY